VSLLVVRPGARSLLQDLGRPGLGALGVSGSGAFDRSAARQANRLLGNATAAAVVEVLLGGLVLEAGADHAVAVTGAVGPVTVDGRQVTHGRAVPLRSGQRLEVGAVTAGLRAYVGVAGGFAGDDELGSRSTDTLAGLGPAPLSEGDELVVGAADAVPDLEDVPALTTSGGAGLDVVLGPRHDWFTDDAVATLLRTAWTVTSSSDRVGVRLDGPALQRSRAEELPSEPCVRGSIQVAADGRPVVFGPDHPVTGGYPVIAVVVDAHADRLAQVRPGETVRFGRRSR
jgi:biotin-dependent carboxylase-like uncharacterized protein